MPMYPGSSGPPSYAVKRCARCDTDFPNLPSYDTCTYCRQATFPSTASAIPDSYAAALDAARHRTIRDHDAAVDARAVARRKAWDAEMNLLLSRTPSIPDPPGCSKLPPLPGRPTLPRPAAPPPPDTNEEGYGGYGGAWWQDPNVDF